MDFIFDPSLVLYLPLYKRDGSSLMSRDHYGHLATVSGAVWTPQGRTFDGVDDFINCGAGTSLDITTAITAEAWLYPQENAGIQYAILGKHNPAAKTGYYLFYKNGAADYKFGLFVGNGTTWFAAGVTASGYSALNTWYHVAVTYNGTTWVFYINGAQENTGTTTPATIATNAVNLNIGRDVSSGTWYFNGSIGECHLYNRVLNALEIRRNYLATRWRYQ